MSIAPPVSSEAAFSERPSAPPAFLYAAHLRFSPPLRAAYYTFAHASPAHRADAEAELVRAERAANPALTAIREKLITCGVFAQRLWLEESVWREVERQVECGPDADDGDVS